VAGYVESARQAEAFLAARGRELRSATRADLEDFLADLLAADTRGRPGPAGADRGGQRHPVLAQGLGLRRVARTWGQASGMPPQDP
jgi:hypothetical protein